MKFRTGFVSNSSSSSFIVEFKEVPTSKEELQNQLFGDRKEYHYPYGTEYFSTDDVSAIVWQDMQGGPATKAEVEEEINNGYPIADHITKMFIAKEPSYDQFTTMDENNKATTDWDAYEKAWDDYTNQFKRFVNWDAVEEGKVYTFEYSDNDGQQFCAMEHGDLFENAKHVLKISHH